MLQPKKATGKHFSILPSLAMTDESQQKKHNGVNGTNTCRDGVSSGRKAYEHQVVSDRHRAATSKTKPKRTQKSSTVLK